MPQYQDYCIIPLTQGQVAIVDPEDHARLSAHKWFACWNPTSRHFYAARQQTVGRKKQRMVKMHAEVMGLAWDSEQTVDHIEPNMTLDNRKMNLRLASKSQQMANRKLFRNHSSGAKGVRKQTNGNGYQARIRYQGKLIHLGTYRTIAEAHQVYCAAAAHFYGEFARFA